MLEQIRNNTIFLRDVQMGYVQMGYVDTLKIGYPTYKLYVKIRSRTCIHVLSCKL
jgi:hypothetical protein